MLNVMRSNLKHLKWVLLLVSLSMVLYLGSYFTFDSSSGARQGADQDWAAYVGGEKITSFEYYRVLNNFEENYRQQLQDQFDALRSALHLPEVAINDLINRKLVIQDAKRLGLSVSPEELRTAIVNYPPFQGDNGFIGKELYAQVLAANNLSVDTFEKGLADDILFDKWRALVGSPAVVTDAEVEKAYRDSAEKVTFDYVVVPPGKWPAPEASEADGRAWFASHADRYRTSDGRKGTYVLIDAATVGASVSVTDDEVRQAYETNKSSYERPEQIRARHILVKIEDGGTAGDSSAEEATDAAARARAEALLAKIRAGADFETVARENSEDPGSASRGGDLGWFGRGAMVKEFEDAAFGATPGQVIGPVKSPFGYHIIEVTDQRPAGIAPLEEVGPALRAQLEATKRREAMNTRAQELLAAGVDASGFDAAAGTMGLAPKDTGVLFPGSEITGLGRQPALLQEILGSPVGRIVGPVTVPGGSVMVAVKEAVPADQMTFDMVRATVMDDLRRERARETAEDGARKQLAAAGGSIEAVAKKLDAELRRAGPVSKGDPVPGVPSDSRIEDAIFSAAAGSPPLVLAASDSSVLIVNVTDKTEPTAQGLAEQRDAIRQRLTEERASSYVSAFLRQLRQATEIRTNDLLIQRSST